MVGIMSMFSLNVDDTKAPRVASACGRGSRMISGMWKLWSKKPMMTCTKQQEQHALLRPGLCVLSRCVVSGVPRRVTLCVASRVVLRTGLLAHPVISQSVWRTVTCYGGGGSGGDGVSNNNDNNDNAEVNVSAMQRDTQ